ncbi:MAG: CPBP family intramembrane glutamic endopeptidase [Aquihabitans sp.]
MAEERPWWPIAAIVTVLVVVNVGSNRLIPSWAYVPWAMAWAVGLVWFVRRFDAVSWDELGLAPAAVGRGLRWGGALAGLVLGGYVIAFVLPATHDLFLDDRVRGWSITQTAYAALVRVPLGTVLLEEVAFRAVLPAVLMRRRSRAVAVGASAALFGLWHVLPALGIDSTNPVATETIGSLPEWTSVLGAVVSTSAVGVWFWWLRHRTGSLLTPMALHWATNGLGYAFAYAAWN